jgi:hypothetical protein
MAQIQPPIFGERSYIFLGVSQTMSRRRAKLAINARRVQLVSATL